MTLYACVPVVNHENGELHPLLARGAAIPADWPEDVRASLEETGCAVSIDEAIDTIEASHEPAFEDPEAVARLRQLLVNDHGREIAGGLSELLSARWLAEIEVAVANGLAAAPAREEIAVEMEAEVTVKKPKARA